MSVKILHFADAHIDSYTGGRIDPANGLPYHTNDFLKALDEIIDTAISAVSSGSRRHVSRC